MCPHMWRSILSLHQIQNNWAQCAQTFNTVIDSIHTQTDTDVFVLMISKYNEGMNTYRLSVDMNLHINLYSAACPKWNLSHEIVPDVRLLSNIGLAVRSFWALEWETSEICIGKASTTRCTFKVSRYLIWIEFAIICLSKFKFNILYLYSHVPEQNKWFF